MTSAEPWDASTYDEVSSVQHTWGRKVIDWRTWRGDETVLDAGCGTGQLAEALLERVPRGRVIAVDADPNMVAQARARLARHHARASVHQADLLQLEGIPPVDVVFSNAVLHWIQDHDRVFEVFLHHLKPGGEVLIQCGGDGNLERARTIGKELMSRPEFSAHFKSWAAPWRYEDDASTEERLLIAGYVHPKVWLEAAPATFGDSESFARFARTVVLRSYLASLPTPALQQRFVEAFVARAEETGLGHTLDYVRLNIQAKRAPHA